MTDRLRIAIQSASGGRDWQGGINYIQSLILGLRSLPAEDRQRFETILLLNSESEASYYEDAAAAADAVLVLSRDMAAATLLRRATWLLRRRFGTEFNPRLTDFLQRASIDFYFSGVLNSDRRDRPRHAKWLPDFQFLRMPEGMDRGLAASWKEDFAMAVRSAPRIVLSSGEAEKDCLELFPSTRGRTHIHRFRVALPERYFSVSPEVASRQYGLDGPYFIVCNLLAPTKNHGTIVRALGILKRKGVRCLVASTGSLYDYRNPHFSSQFMSTIHSEGVHDSFRVLGSVPRDMQMSLMRGAAAVLQPSQFEGWSSSVEEAVALGKRLILSDIPVHREQARGRTDFFDPLDADALAHGMESVLRGGDDGPNAQAIAVERYRAESVDASRAFLRLAGL